MVFTFALGDKLQAAGSKVKACVAHPGISRTSLFNYHHGAAMAKAGVLEAFPLQAPADGALGIITCSLHPDIGNRAYYGPGGKEQSDSFGGPAISLDFMVPLMPQCDDEAAKTMLWKASSAISGPFLESTELEGKHYEATMKEIPSQKGKVVAITGCTRCVLVSGVPRPRILGA